MHANNLLHLLTNQIKHNPDKAALHEKINKSYQKTTYKTLENKVIKLAHALNSLNTKKNDKIAILSNNKPEWVISDLAILSLGCSVIPIYPTLSEQEIIYILNHSETKILIIEKIDRELAHTIQTQCAHLNHIISINETDQDKILYFQELIQNNHTTYPNDINTIKEDTIASIVYTSGTTGKPKGVPLTHLNFLSNVKSIIKRLPLSQTERVLSFLPLSHVFERTAGYYTLLALGGEIYYAENINTVGENIKETKPTIVVSVPRLYEKMQAKILGSLSPIKRILFNWAINIGKKKRSNNKKTLSFYLANKLVFEKIKKKTGGSLKFFVSGGAPLNKEIAEFFYGLGIMILEGYGMTEAAPVIACNHPQEFKFGTVGKALDCSTIKLTHDKELLVKGPHIMTGYYKKKKKSEVDIDQEGWLHTGDLAEIDNEGYIKIIDRKKDILVLSTGKNIAPQVIENHIRKSKFIEQIVCIGNKRPYLTAIIVANKEEIEKFADKSNISYNSYDKLLKIEEIIQKLKSEIKTYQQEHAAYEKIKKIHIVEEEFTQENGTLTPTLKPKRNIIINIYQSNITKLYE